MPAKRTRVKPSGKPADCIVTIVGEVAQYLYREKIRLGYATETELVNKLLRDWAKEEEEREPMDWKDVRADIKREEKEE